MQQRTKVKAIGDGGISPAPPAPAPPAPPPLTTTTMRRGKRQRGSKGELALQTALMSYPTLIDELAELGFNASADFIVRHDPARIKQAVERARSMKGIRNVPGFIRFLVTKPGPIPAPERDKKDDPDRFIKGKYGHLVQR